MSRTGSYGQSFAMKYLGEGKLEEALAEADQASSQDPADPEPVLERAQVLLAMSRYPDVVAAIERALELDRAVRIIDDMTVDDTLFSALVGWGQQLAQSDVPAALEVLARYRALLPAGIHHGEADDWSRRFRGQVETWVKAR
jgi:tetratricopeptide (TPR) repeat protein